MNYSQTLTWLFERLPMYQRVGPPAMRLGLDQMNRLSAALGDPHRSTKSIHIAGTNGKGSTSSIISKILQEKGYKVGLYTSPHLIRFNERIRINGKPISDVAIIKFIEKHKQTLIDSSITFFEATTALAFNYFSQKNLKPSNMFQA